jgi:hypothetical protein
MEPQEGHIAIAFEGASWTSEYAFPMMVMQELLGSYDSACAMDRSRASSYVQIHYVYTFSETYIFKTHTHIYTHIHTHIYTHTYTHTHTHINIYIYIYIYNASFGIHAI